MEKNKCKDCGKEIEKPYIRCDNCHENYLKKLLQKNGN